MTARLRPHQSHPLLGIYFGIFVASLMAVVLLLLIFEQLGVAEGRLRFALTAGSIALYALIGAAAFTSEPGKYVLASRRIPSLLAGLALAVAAIGGGGISNRNGESQTLALLTSPSTMIATFPRGLVSTAATSTLSPTLIVMCWVPLSLGRVP